MLAAESHSAERAGWPRGPPSTPNGAVEFTGVANGVDVDEQSDGRARLPAAPGRASGRKHVAHGVFRRPAGRHRCIVIGGPLRVTV